MNISSFESEFNKIMRRDYFTSHVKPIREQAFNNFLEKGLPNKNWEDWRHTDLKPIKEIDFCLSEIRLSSLSIATPRVAEASSESLRVIVCNKKDFTFDDIVDCDEAFVTGTFAGIIPVSKLEDRDLKSTNPDSLANQIRFFQVFEPFDIV